MTPCRLAYLVVVHILLNDALQPILLIFRTRWLEYATTQPLPFRMVELAFPTKPEADQHGVAVGNVVRGGHQIRLQQAVVREVFCPAGVPGCDVGGGGEAVQLGRGRSFFNRLASEELEGEVVGTVPGIRTRGPLYQFPPNVSQTLWKSCVKIVSPILMRRVQICCRGVQEDMAQARYGNTWKLLEKLLAGKFVSTRSSRPECSF